MVSSYPNKKCPECETEMTYIPELKTFDGSVPGKFICNKCGYTEEE